MNIGIVATLPALIVGREFGHGEFMGVLGLTTAIGQATYAFGPLLVGLLRDNAGDRVGLAACSSLSLAACVAVMFKASADGVPAAGQTWTERGRAQPPRAGEP
jgi:MFS family permease